MRILEIDALVANSAIAGAVFGVTAPAQAVRNEEDQVPRRGVLRRRGRVTDAATRPADSNTIVRRITFSP